MYSKSVVVFCIVAYAAATDVLQCPGLNIANLKESVQLSPCKKSPCKLKKGTDQHITINFTPDEDIAVLKNNVIADVFGVELPFVGVDGIAICDKIQTEDGQKASCPLKAGVKYTYKDSFPVLDIYPTIQVNVRWALLSGKNKVICFETPVKIVK